MVGWWLRLGNDDNDDDDDDGDDNDDDDDDDDDYDRDGLSLVYRGLDHFAQIGWHGVWWLVVVWSGPCSV